MVKEGTSNSFATRKKQTNIFQNCYLATMIIIWCTECAYSALFLKLAIIHFSEVSTVLQHFKYG